MRGTGWRRGESTGCEQRGGSSPGRGRAISAGGALSVAGTLGPPLTVATSLMLYSAFQGRRSPTNPTVDPGCTFPLLVTAAIALGWLALHHRVLVGLGNGIRRGAVRRGGRRGFPGASRTGRGRLPARLRRPGVERLPAAAGLRIRGRLQSRVNPSNHGSGLTRRSRRLVAGRHCRPTAHLPAQHPTGPLRRPGLQLDLCGLRSSRSSFPCVRIPDGNSHTYRLVFHLLTAGTTTTWYQLDTQTPVTLAAGDTLELTYTTPEYPKGTHLEPRQRQ